MGYKIDLVGQEQHFRRRGEKGCKIHVTKPALYLKSFVWFSCVRPGGLDEDGFFSCMSHGQKVRETP